MRYEPKGIEPIELNTIAIDLNGTLTVYGEIEEGVKEELAGLRNLGFEIYLLTGDQRGTAAILAEEIGITLKIATTAEEKEAFVKTLDTEKLVAIGNGRIDIGMFKHAKLSIGTLREEGIHTGIIPHIDVLIPSMLDALKFLKDPDVFCATMRI